MNREKTALELAGFVLADGTPFRASMSYDAAGHGRRLGGWRATSAGPNTVNQGSANTLRSRSRDSVRNNAWIRRGINNWVANEVGTGFVPTSMAPDPKFAAAANKLWALWSKEADADGVLDVYGLQALAVRARQEAGEAFIRLRPRRLEDGLTVPLQLQMLESDHVPFEKNEDGADRIIRQGIEFSPIGQRVAYWMYSRHPGEMGGGNLELKRVFAKDVIHHYAPLRIGQVRGMPWTIQALIKAKDFDEYDDAELQRKKIRAHFTGVIERENFDENDWEFDPFTGDKIERDGSGVGMGNLEPGSFPALLPGEKINLFKGDEAGLGYADYCRQQLMAAAAALDLPYEILSGDMRNVNDRILRAILNEYHRIIEQTQWLFTIPQVCDPIWAAFIDAAVLAGKLSAPDYAERKAEYQAAEWRPQAWAYLHPVQDVQGKLLKIKGGLSSRSKEVAKEGEDAAAIDQQNAEDSKRAVGLGLQYDSDPGKVAQD